MEASDVADQIREVREAIAEEKAEHDAGDRFRARAALIIAFLAVLLAISSLGGGNVGEDMVHANIQASDTWAFYQAKNVRQTVNKLAADELEADLLIHGGAMGAAARQDIEEKISKYRATADRYDSEPDPKDPTNPLKGEGKKELSAQAKNWESQRERAEEQDANFDFAEVLFQIGIVLGSVAILATSRPVLGVSLGLSALATLLMLNGFFLVVHLPF